VPDIFHITLPAHWEQAQRDGAITMSTRDVTLAEEGFVHCSFAEQVVATAARYYAGRTDVVLLEIDELRLTARLVVEPSPSTGDLYPHVYGAINRSAVVAVHEFRPAADGTFALPEGLSGDT
jgi:uncharacterized protein (DUF952 family)